MTNDNIIFEEKITTDDFGMPLRYYYVNSSDEKDLVMFAHWHNEIEIQIFLNGSAAITIDNKEFNVEKNDIVFIPSQSIHFGCAKSVSLEVHNFVFHTEVMCSLNHDSSVQKYFLPFINRTAKIPYVIHTTDKGYAALRKCLDEIVTLTNSKPKCYELLIRNHLINFFINLYLHDYVQTKATSSVADKNYLAVKNAITYIERNFSKPLTVDEIAAQAGFSKSRFMSIFKEFTNTTCKKFINNCRMESAKQMLIETNQTVLNIAVACGYNNISLFNREFKKAYGSTPLEFRKSNRSSEQTFYD